MKSGVLPASLLIVVTTLSHCVLPSGGYPPYPISGPYRHQDDSLFEVPRTSDAYANPELAEQLQDVKNARQEIEGLAARVASDGRFTPVEIAALETPFEKARRDWRLAGQSVVRDLRTNQARLSPTTYAAINRAKIAQQAFNGECAKLDDRRFVVGYTVLQAFGIQFVSEFFNAYMAAVRRGEQMRFETQVQREFEVRPWRSIVSPY